MQPGWQDKEALRAALLAWFAASHRDLPWRTRESLYGVWVAEIMLQQTTVEAVVPYYHRFMERFPDVQALAEADFDEVLAEWSGLGYYRRASMLHGAAGIIVSERDGCFPDSSAGWRRLPGVGEYASGAIASLGLGERVAAVDANARRVLLRWLCPTPECAAGIGKARLRNLADEMVPHVAPGDWNEAVMELGALICRARAPGCDVCPVSAWCRAAGSNDPAAVPAPPAPPVRIPVVLAQLVVTDGERTLLLRPGAMPAASAPGGTVPVREDFTGLFHGMNCLPSTPWLDRACAPELDPRRLWISFLNPLAGPHAGLRPEGIGECRHTVTRFDLLVRVHGLRVAPAALDPGGNWPDDWVVAEPSAPGIPVSRLTRKVLAIARAMS